MRFGVREICDVVLRAKNDMKIGNMKFEKDAPVFYFDSLKTSSLESAATTVYATGGKGNSRLIAWDGEKTVTFTMEDALISPVSLSMLSGAEVIETGEEEIEGTAVFQELAVGTATSGILGTISISAGTVTIDNLVARPYVNSVTVGSTTTKTITVNVVGSTSYIDFDDEEGVQPLTITSTSEIVTQNTNGTYKVVGTVTGSPSLGSATVVVIKYTKGATGSTTYTHATETIEITRSGVGAGTAKITKIPVISGIGNYGKGHARDASTVATYGAYLIPLDSNGDIKGEPIRVSKNAIIQNVDTDGKYVVTFEDSENDSALAGLLPNENDTGLFLFDYYYSAEGKVTVMNITPDKFAGSYYLEGSTLFRTKSGKDLPAEFIVPNCKIQSNFTFTMASSGDPSTFTFTMDAFPDYPKHSPTTKVLAAIQLLEDSSTSSNSVDNSVVSLF